MPVLVAIAIAFLATVLLGILAVGLLRNLRALAAAIGRFQEDVGGTPAAVVAGASFGLVGGLMPGTEYNAIVRATDKPSPVPCCFVV